jgi:integrase
MTIRQRGDVYQVDVTGPSGKRVRRSVGTLSEAKIEEATLTLSLASAPAEKPLASLAGFCHVRMPTKVETLGDLFTLTHRLHWKGTKGEVTAVINGEDIVKTIGTNVLVSDITTDLVDMLVDELQSRGLAAATVNRKLAGLSKMMTTALDRGLITKVPKIQFKEEGQHRIRWMTLEEERTALGLLKSWGMHSVAEMLVVGIKTGFRASELMGLQARDYSDGMLHLWNTKNSLNRSVPVLATVAAILQIRKVKGFTKGLFSDVKRQDIAKAVSMLRVSMDLQDDEDFCWHSMTRHTCASRMVQRGVELLVVKTYLGHKSMNTTLRYAHLAPQNLATAAAALEDTHLTEENEPCMLNLNGKVPVLTT